MVVERKVFRPEEVAALEFVDHRAVFVQAFVDFGWLEFLAVRQFLELQSDLGEAFGEYSTVQVEVDDRTERKHQIHRTIGHQRKKVELVRRTRCKFKIQSLNFKLLN